MKDKFKMVNEVIQEFSLPNSHGETVNIRDFKGKKVVVILFRSIHWPYCRWHAAHLRKEYETFRELNAELFPILVDDKDNAIKMENKYARKYPIYYDEEKTVANMLNQEVKLLKLGRLPALLILDPENVIRYAYYGDSMSDIPENEQLFEILRKINKNPKN